MSDFYRKKPVMIEAFQMTAARHESNEGWPEWLRAAWNKSSIHAGAVYEVVGAGLYISTLEGQMKIGVGDYIIRGVKGELYPCKPDIFELTYEKVEQTSTKEDLR